MDFKTFLNQISTIFQNLSLKQRIVIISSIVVVVAFLVFLALYKGDKKTSYDGYGVLFDNVDPSDSALIVQQLDADKIPYKLVDEKTIMVPTESVYKERIAVAALGIPKKSKVGFEIFDKQEFGATDFEQRIKYLRALEGELGRTIESLMPINKASVHIAIPKESVFVEKQTLPTASVVVEVNPSLKITAKQITGIKNLVSASVMKLPPENVKIVNQDGLPLGEKGMFDDDVIKNQIAYQKDFEREYEKKIRKALSPIVGGDDKVVANVTIEFDFAREDSVSEVYDPNSVPRSEQSVEEKREGFSPQDIGGVPGAVSNIGPVKGLQDDKIREKYSKNTATTNYEISKTVTNKKDAFATIARVSAAVVVDGKYELEKKGKKKVLKYVALSEEELDMLNAIVKQTIGYKAVRGDQVTVSNFKFKRLKLDGKEEIATQTLMNKIAAYSKPVIPLLKYLMVFVLLWIFYKKVITPFAEYMVASIEEEEEKPTLDADEEIEDESAEDTLERFHKAKKKVEEQLGIGGDFNEEELRYDVLLEKLRAVANEKSEEVAQLLQNMVQTETGYGELKD